MIRVARTIPEHVYLAAKKAQEVYSGEEGLIQCTLNGVESGRAFTLYDSMGRIGCIVGHDLLWRGVSSVWGLITTDIHAHPVSYVRMVNRLLNSEVKQFKLHRMEVAVKIGYAPAHKLVRTLKFKPEGIMQAYGEDKSDSILYGRIF